MFKGGLSFNHNTYDVDKLWGRRSGGLSEFGLVSAVAGDSQDRVYLFIRKPVAEMLDILCPLAQTVVLTGLPVPRGEAPGTLLRLAAERHSDTRHAPTVEGALRLAFDGAPPGALVVVSGSLYLVGEVKRILAR